MDTIMALLLTASILSVCVYVVLYIHKWALRNVIFMHFKWTHVYIPVLDTNNFTIVCSASYIRCNAC